MIFKKIYSTLITTASWQRWFLLIILIGLIFCIWHTFLYKPYICSWEEREILLADIAQYDAIDRDDTTVPSITKTITPAARQEYLTKAAYDSGVVPSRLIVTSKEPLHIEIDVSGSYESIYEFIELAQSFGMLWSSAVMTETALCGTLVAA